MIFKLKKKKKLCLILREANAVSAGLRILIINNTFLKWNGALLASLPLLLCTCVYAAPYVSQ